MALKEGKGLGLFAVVGRNSSHAVAGRSGDGEGNEHIKQVTDNILILTLGTARR